MTSNFVQVNGIKLFTNVGLWPYNDDGVRLWSGSIRIDATDAEIVSTITLGRSDPGTKSDQLLSLNFNLRWKPWGKAQFQELTTNYNIIAYFSETAITGIRFGAVATNLICLSSGALMELLKVPEPAIGTAIMTVIIDNVPTDLNLYKLDGAEELFFGTGEPSLLKKLAILKRNPKKTLWENFDEHRRAFEAVSTHIKPIFQNSPTGLTACILNSPTRTSTWQLLNQIIYPVVLELLQELGDFAKEEAKTMRNHAVGSKWPSRNVEASDVTEMVLLRLSKKLQEEYKNTNSARNESTPSL
ncbi:unnamed protein product [Angiostrongylus costaricensis]|uniref:RNase_PH domain-containing protein n=1 Tax=Angiostrongylus costaricensis TaxID=334426 RepID=A0A0R3PDS1_ANGCS|nr:unnamed protein product [Angiostrongylus costaricensis]